MSTPAASRSKALIISWLRDMGFEFIVSRFQLGLISATMVAAINLYERRSAWSLA
jgi:hypothetical protein